MSPADIERHKARACTGKRQFATKAEAKQEAKAVRKKYGVTLRTYACAFCDGYHHTSRPLADIEGIQEAFYGTWRGVR
jgi:hypothetical protein